ncbi:MAG TPA: septal ring lytic transglycosylase RlpA family protein [Polyangiaceae bacterium]|nr:septal ring lytic transglycosylase RlpA family protein [Polyangiaceae bacterium]
MSFELPPIAANRPKGRAALGILLPASIACAVAPATVAGCAHEGAVPAAAEPPEQAAGKPREPRAETEFQQGYATWYGGKLAGHRTADGGVFDPRAMTAAHRTLPFGTWVEVTCVDTGRSVRVRITDRGPFGHAERIIDLSRAAADKLGIRSRGIAPVAIHVVDGP